MHVFLACVCTCVHFQVGLFRSLVRDVLKALVSTPCELGVQLVHITDLKRVKVVGDELLEGSAPPTGVSRNDRAEYGPVSRVLLPLPDLATVVERYVHGESSDGRSGCQSCAL